VRIIARMLLDLAGLLVKAAGGAIRGEHLKLHLGCGTIHIAGFVRIYANNWQHFQTPPHSPWIGLIYGGQSTPYDYHRTGFNFVWMNHLLEAAGFVGAQEYPHEPHWLGVRDASLAREPFGDHVSLNVLARKPGRPEA